MKTILSLLSLGCTVGLFAQTAPLDTVSLDEMKAAYYRNLQGKSVDSEDTHSFWEGFEAGSKYGAACVVNSPDMKIGKLKLPQGVWKSNVLINIGKDGKEIRNVYYKWMRPRTLLSPSDSSFVSQLESKYDKGMGLPSKLFVGSRYSCPDPVNYNGILVSGYLYEKPHALGDTNDHRVSHKRTGSLREEVWRLAPGFDGPWYKGYGGTEVFLFQHDINRICQGDTLRKGEREFTFLLFIDSRGKAHLQVLLPEKLTPLGEARVAALSAAVEQQPAWIFGYLYTADGRVFPGRYLKATYFGPEEGWTFKDPIVDSIKNIGTRKK